jgi:DNA-directed RNA polymerase subunit RPC12/RpoP
MEAYDYIILSSILVCLALIILVIFHSKTVEKKYFNGGVCLDCKTPLERLNEEGARLRSYYCPNCFSIITIFFRVDKNVNVNQHDSGLEENEEDKNEKDNLVTSL